MIRAVIVGFLAGVFLAFLIERAEAEPKVCASYIGMCHQRFPCNEALAVFSGIDEPCVGWLQTTFGKVCTCPKRFLSLVGKKTVRIHILNGTCFKARGRVCAQDEVFANETIRSADAKFRSKNPAIVTKFRRALREAKRLLKSATAETRVLLSPCLECPLSDRARAVMMAETRKTFPGLETVDSVLTQKCLPGSICEKHGVNARPPAPCVVDTDGNDFLTMDVPAWLERNKQCRAFLWTPSFNLLCTLQLGQGFQMPLQRSCGPTREDLTQLRSWLTYSPGL